MQFDEMHLVALGQLLDSSYEFSTPGNGAVKSHLRKFGRVPAQTAADIFGWGRQIEPASKAAAWIDSIRRAGICDLQASSGLKSLLRAGTVGNDLVFHSAAPGAHKDAVFLGPDTYKFISRLRQHALCLAPAPRTIVEVGCGSGAASIALARMFPDAQIIGLDINPTAIALCRVNAKIAQIDNLTARVSDVLDGFEGTADLIVSNPPFIADVQQRTYRHGGGQFGLELPKRIVVEASNRLNNKGALLMYTGSPVDKDGHVFSRLLTESLDRGVFDFSLNEIEPSIFEDALDTPPYRDIHRIAAAWLQLTLRE